MSCCSMSRNSLKPWPYSAQAVVEEEEEEEMDFDLFG